MCFDMTMVVVFISTRLGPGDLGTIFETSISAARTASNTLSDVRGSLSPNRGLTGRELVLVVVVVTLAISGSSVSHEPSSSGVSPRCR